MNRLLAVLLLFVLCCCTLPALAADVDEPEQSETAPAAASSDESDRVKVATVLGKDIFLDQLIPTPEFDAQQELLRRQGREHLLITDDQYRGALLAQRVSQPMLEQFAKVNRVEPTAEEIADFVKRLRVLDEEVEGSESDPLQILHSQIELVEGMITSGKLNEEQLADAQSQLKRFQAALANTAEISADPNLREKQNRFFAEWYLRNWKLQRAFYKQYGGRVAMQPVGPQSIDGVRRFFEEQQTKGNFTIYDDDLRNAFWDQFDEAQSQGQFTDDPEFVFSTPWALMFLDKAEQQAPAGQQGRP